MNRKKEHREDEKKKHHHKNEMPPLKESASEAPSISESEDAGKFVQILKSDFEALTQKADKHAELKDRYLRSAADFENAKKRLVKERDQFYKFALEGIIYDILPVIDNFERAVSHIQGDDQAAKAMRQGFELIQKQLFSILEDRGLKRLKTLHQKFDPHVHEAVEHVPTDKATEETIIEEVLAGYEMNGKLLRASKVKVAAAKKCADENEVTSKPDSEKREAGGDRNE